MNTEPRPDLSVTVLIAAYNAADFIAHAIASAQEQTHAVQEILVVDDASTDTTGAVVEALAQHDRRIRLLRLSENGGPSKARNAGLAAASGEWVAVLDADDVYMPARIGHLLQVATAYEADVVADNFAWFNVRSGVLGQAGLATSEPPEVVSIERFVDRAKPFTDESDWGLLKPMFRRAYMDAQRLRYPVQSRHGEDYLLMFDLLRSGGRYVVTRQLGYRYTDRSSGFSRTRVDYGAMVEHSAQLLAHPFVLGRPDLARLMQARVDALRRLKTNYEAVQAVRRFDLSMLVRRGLADQLFCQAAGRHLAERARAAVRKVIRLAGFGRRGSRTERNG